MCCCCCRVLDQTLKQSIPMTGGVSIASDNKDKMIVHTRRALLLLLPVPLDKQVSSIGYSYTYKEVTRLYLYCIALYVINWARTSTVYIRTVYSACTYTIQYARAHSLSKFN